MYNKHTLITLADSQNTASESPADLEHEVYRRLRVETDLIIIGIRVLEVRPPKPCICIVQTVEKVVYMKGERHRGLIRVL